MYLDKGEAEISEVLCKRNVHLTCQHNIGLGCEIFIHHQFQACHFYTNWESDFLDHWQSDLHKMTNRNDEDDGDWMWWCSFCDSMARGNEEALEVSALTKICGTSDTNKQYQIHIHILSPTVTPTVIYRDRIEG